MEASLPLMLSANQIEAHVTRLTAVREGLRKYPDDGRAKEAGDVIEVAINTLNLDAFPAKDAHKVAFIAKDDEATSEVSTSTPPTVEQEEAALKDEAEEAAEIGEKLSNEGEAIEDDENPQYNSYDPSREPSDDGPPSEPTPLRQ